MTRIEQARTFARTLSSDTTFALATIYALLLLGLAEWQFQDQRLTVLGILLLLLGLGLWIWLLKVDPPPRDSPGLLAPAAPAPRYVLLGAAATAAVLGFLNTGGNVFRAAGVLPWLLAVALWLVAWWPEPSLERTEARRTDLRRTAALLLALALIMALAAFFRYHRLAQTPADPTGDHAEKLLDIYDLLNGKRPIFFVRNTGREPAQFYFTFGLIKVLGLSLSFETLKAGTALIDTLAIPAIYLLAAELAGTPVGLLATTLYSIGKWPVAFSRMGLRYPYAPLPAALVLWALFRYIRRGTRRDALLCGLFLGIGLYGYSPIRVVALAVPALLGLVLLFDPRRRGRRIEVIQHGLLIVITAALVFLPLAHFMIEQPYLFWYRALTRATGTERSIAGNGLLDTELSHILTFLSNNLNAALAFNWRGDISQVNLVSLDPFLDPATAASFLAGIILVLSQIIRRNLRALGMLVCLGICMLSTTLSIAFPIENPSANRSGVSAPIVFIIAALPLAQLVRRAGNLSRPLGLTLAGVSLAAFLAIAAPLNYVRYFRDYDQQYRAFVPNTHEVAEAIQKERTAYGVPLDHVYVLASPYWIDTRNLAFTLGDIGWQAEHSLLPDMDLPRQVDGQPLVFALNVADGVGKSRLEASFPRGTYTYVRSTTPGKDFALYVVPRQ